MQLPPKPVFNASSPQRWDAWGDALDENMRVFVAELPQMKATVTDQALRVGAAESAASQATADVASMRFDVSSAKTQSSEAVRVANDAVNRLVAAEGRVSQAVDEARAAASQSSTVTTTVDSHTNSISSLQTGKADRSELAAVARTGKYADLIGAPTGTGGGAEPTVADLTSVYTTARGGV